tara:strand:+ start:1581 stop:2489 length:909 start_codon:yes stop_codon:yes gene_type:complete
MSKNTIRCFGNPESLIKNLKECGVKFTKQETTSTTIITNEDTKWVYGTLRTRFLSKKEMMLQKQLVAHIKKNTEGKDIFPDPRQPIKYFQFDYSLRKLVDYAGEVTSLNNIIEMDITMAYWRVAFNLGYINEDFYKKVKNIPKYMRLRLLGSIAAEKIIEEYEGKKRISINVKSNPKMQAVYKNICKETGNIMSEVADAIGDYFIFYWVDGIYFKKDPIIEKNELQPSVQVVEYIFNKHNLEFKIKNIEKLLIINKKETIYLQLYMDNKLKSRFNIKLNKIKYKQIEHHDGKFQPELLEAYI